MGLEKIWSLLVETYEEGFKDGFKAGAKEGYGVGYDDGFVDGVDSERNAFKPAVSDGLRHSSSECGRTMNRFKK